MYSKLKTVTTLQGLFTQAEINFLAISLHLFIFRVQITNSSLHVCFGLSQFLC